MDNFPAFVPQCPAPLDRYPHVLMAHGGGGKLMHQLLEKIFLPAFGNNGVDARHDSAVLERPSGRIAFTTDSHVVHPLFFPGGDIGSLSVHGTVNDLAMSGARPLCLSAGFILEEGLPMDALWRVVCSMQQAAQRAGVRIVTGDTKVVDRGKGDGVFINTAGIGIVEHALTIAPSRVRADDAILISGDVGRHGMAIIAARQGLEFETTILSDSAPVAGLVLELLHANIEIHCLRDLTRGGLASALNEIAQDAGVQVTAEEPSIPVNEDVHAACEILGLDPLHVACEGRFVMFVPPKDSQRALSVMQAHPLGAGARTIGVASRSDAPRVILKNAMGGRRILTVPSGEQLPRIC